MEWNSILCSCKIDTRMFCIPTVYLHHFQMSYNRFGTGCFRTSFSDVIKLIDLKVETSMEEAKGYEIYHRICYQVPIWLATSNWIHHCHRNTVCNAIVYPIDWRIRFHFVYRIVHLCDCNGEMCQNKLIRCRPTYGCEKRSSAAIYRVYWIWFTCKMVKFFDLSPL